MAQVVTYGLGGYDPKKKDGNVVSVVDIPDDPEVVARQSALDVIAAQLDTGKADPTDKAFKDAIAALILEA